VFQRKKNKIKFKKIKKYSDTLLVKTSNQSRNVDIIKDFSEFNFKKNIKYDLFFKKNKYKNQNLKRKIKYVDKFVDDDFIFFNEFLNSEIKILNNFKNPFISENEHIDDSVELKQYKNKLDQNLINYFKKNNNYFFNKFSNNYKDFRVKNNLENYEYENNYYENMDFINLGKTNFENKNDYYSYKWFEKYQENFEYKNDYYYFKLFEEDKLGFKYDNDYYGDSIVEEYKEEFEYKDNYNQYSWFEEDGYDHILFGENTYDGEYVSNNKNGNEDWEDEDYFFWNKTQFEIIDNFLNEESVDEFFIDNMFNKNIYEDFKKYYNFKKSKLDEYNDFYYYYFNNKIKDNISTFSIEKILKKLKIKNLYILNKIINNIKEKSYFNNKFLKYNKLFYKNIYPNYNNTKNSHIDKLLENDVLYLKFKDSNFNTLNDLSDISYDKFNGNLEMSENILQDNSTKYWNSLISLENEGDSDFEDYLFDWDGFVNLEIDLDVDNYDYFLNNENLVFNDYFDIDNMLIGDFENSEIVNFENSDNRDFEDFFLDDWLEQTNSDKSYIKKIELFSDYDLNKWFNGNLQKFYKNKKKYINNINILKKKLNSDESFSKFSNKLKKSRLKKLNMQLKKKKYLYFSDFRKKFINKINFKKNK